jgi:hypothetical protein
MSDLIKIAAADDPKKASIGWAWLWRIVREANVLFDCEQDGISVEAKEGADRDYVEAIARFPATLKSGVATPQVRLTIVAMRGSIAGITIGKQARIALPNDKGETPLEVFKALFEEAIESIKNGGEVIEAK